MKFKLIIQILIKQYNLWVNHTQSVMIIIKNNLLFFRKKFFSHTFKLINLKEDLKS